MAINFMCKRSRKIKTSLVKVTKHLISITSHKNFSSHYEISARKLLGRSGGNERILATRQSFVFHCCWASTCQTLKEFGVRSQRNMGLSRLKY